MVTGLAMESQTINAMPILLQAFVINTITQIFNYVH